MWGFLRGQTDFFFVGKLGAPDISGRGAVLDSIHPHYMVVTSLVAGLLLRFSIWETLDEHQMFDDASYWTLPDDGFPSVGAEPSQVEEKMEQNDKREEAANNV